MKTISRYIMTLALLLTAATGAWAADTYTVAGSSSDMFGTAWDAYNTANDMTKNGDGTYSITYTNVSLDGDVQYKVVKNRDWEEAYPADENRVINIAEPGTYTLTIHFDPTTNEVYETMPGSGSGEPDVTINDAKTEASFKMPQYDVTATYTIKRDISVDVTATMGDGTDGVRYRVKKDGKKFIPADMEMAAVPALFTVNDAIEQKALTQTQDYIVQIYAIDAEGQPTGDPMTFATFTFEPGIYAVKAVAADGSDYAGETALSNTFQLFQGYEVTVPAGEFATFYKDENLYTEDEDAQLYTIQSVTGDEAVLSSQLNIVAANTPMLVYNAGEVTATFLLIPTEDDADEVTAAPEFVGTLEATTIAASTDDQTNYALNGKQFVFVKNAIPVAANKAWLAMPTATARLISIVFGDATGVNGELRVENGEMATATWYDLNGRKLDKMPTKKGVYIMNGKKVVVK